MKIRFVCLFMLIYTLCLSQSKHIHSVKYEGLKKTRITFIQKTSLIKELAVIDSFLIEKDLQNLKRLPSIANATYTINQDSAGEYNLTYKFEENFTVIPTFSIWTSVRNVAFKIGVVEFNFLGTNKSIGGYYQYNGFHSYFLGYKDPFLFSRKFGIEINHSNWTSEEPLYFDEETANYKYSNLSFEILGLYQANYNHKISFGVTQFKETYNYLNGYQASDIPTDVSKNKTMLKLGYEYNDLNYFFYLLSGFKSSLSYQHVVIPEPFWIAWNDFNCYLRIGKKGNYAVRARLGLANNDNSPFAPFALDNNVNIRGIGNIIDRGTATIVLNNEYRYSLYDRKWLAIQANVFVDAGTWRNPGGDFTDFTDQENVKIYSGLGVRFIHKRIYGATLRIDYGVNLKETKEGGLVFGIGQYF